MSADFAAGHGESPAGTITYYESWDFGFLIACVSGKHNFPDMFRFWENRVGEDPPAAWEFLPYESPLWDTLNQNIFRQYRAKIVTDAARLAKLPPVPPVPDGDPPPRESYFLPETPPRAADFPRFCAELLRRGGDEATLTVTLEEDAYESSSGDGKFLMLYDAVLPSDDALQAEISGDALYEPTETKGWYRYYRRSLVVRRVGEQIEFPRFKLAVFDNYRPVEALEKAEARLVSDGSKPE